MRETEFEPEKTFDPGHINSALVEKAKQLRRPLSCHFELTYRCNFHCPMCYIRMTDEQAKPYGRLRTADEWIEMGKQIRDAGVLNLTLTGGECTLFPEFDRLYTELYKMGFRIFVMSNGAAWTDKIRELFRKYPPHGVSITLYGTSDETYEKVTGDPNGFPKVKETVRFLRSIGVHYHLSYTVIKQNVYDLARMKSVCEELQAPYDWITDVFQHRYDPSYSDALNCRLSPAERVCLEGNCREPEKAMQKAKELEKELADFQMPKFDPHKLCKPIGSCNGSYVNAAIFWNGEMNTCISMCGADNLKPFEVGFEQAWKQLQEDFPKKFCVPVACWTCELQASCILNCSARQFQGTGYFYKTDPYTCQFAWLIEKMANNKDSSNN